MNTATLSPSAKVRSGLDFGLPEIFHVHNRFAKLEVHQVGGNLRPNLLAEARFDDVAGNVPATKARKVDLARIALEGVVYLLLHLGLGHDDGDALLRGGELVNLNGHGRTLGLRGVQ